MEVKTSSTQPARPMTPVFPYCLLPACSTGKPVFPPNPETRSKVMPQQPSQTFKRISSSVPQDSLCQGPFTPRLHTGHLLQPDPTASPSGANLSQVLSPGFTQVHTAALSRWTSSRQ